MVAITRKVADLTSPLRQALEEAVGRPLRDEQQVEIQVCEAHEVSPQSPAPVPGANDERGLPDWCDVYEGLSEDQLTELDQIVEMRAQLGRSFK